MSSLSFKSMYLLKNIRNFDYLDVVYTLLFVIFLVSLQLLIMNSARIFNSRMPSNRNGKMPTS